MTQQALSLDCDLGDSLLGEGSLCLTVGMPDEIGNAQDGRAIDTKGHLDPPRPGHSPGAGQGFLPTPPQPHSPKGSSKRVAGDDAV